MTAWLYIAIGGILVLVGTVSGTYGWHLLSKQEEVVQDENTKIEGSVILNQGQLGGQVAHSITNVGSQPRALTEQTLKEMAFQLSQYPAEQYEIETNSDDSDGAQLAHQLTIALNTAGWQCLANARSMFPTPMYGLTVSYRERTEAVATLLELLERASLSPEEKQLPDIERVHILIGYKST